MLVGVRCGVLAGVRRGVVAWRAQVVRGGAGWVVARGHLHLAVLERRRLPEHDLVPDLPPPPPPLRQKGGGLRRGGAPRPPIG